VRRALTEPVVTAQAGAEGLGWSGNDKALSEQRDATVHSSQAKIKIVV
jgi:hypothetical protein